MKNEKSIFIDIVAIMLLAVLAYFIYTVAVSSGSGIKLLDGNKIEDRVAVRYIDKNVRNVNSTYEWGGQAEDSAANIVTSIVADYRLFDTTLEVIVLFITVLGFGLVLPVEYRKIKKPSQILGSWSPILIVFMLLVGGYMFINGHLSPGGGFPAGAILSSAVLVGVVSQKRTFSAKTFKVIEAAAGASIFLIGIAGYLLKGTFFVNFMEGQNIGDLFSAGFIPLIYTLIAFKVASELSGLYFDFYREGEDIA